MNDTQKMKRNFRASKAWKLFRHQKYVEQNGRCPICGMKLGKTANLHHLDLNADNYTDLSKTENFVFLCNTCHDFIHYKFKAYCRGEFDVKALTSIWDKMKEINK